MKLRGATYFKDFRTFHKILDPTTNNYGRVRFQCFPAYCFFSLRDTSFHALRKCENSIAFGTVPNFTCMFSASRETRFECHIHVFASTATFVKITGVEKCHVEQNIVRES